MERRWPIEITGVVFELLLTTDRADELEPATEDIVATAVDQLGY